MKPSMNYPAMQQAATAASQQTTTRPIPATPSIPNRK